MVYSNCLMFVSFLFVLDKLFILFRIAFWPSAGKELSSWLSACTVFFFCAVFLSCQDLELDCIGS